MITEFHKENMRIHIKFLRDNADRIRRHFDMQQLVNPEFIGCGTAACSLGWACVSVGWRYDYDNSELELFGINGNDGGRQSTWAYCFDYDWYYVDNTPEAAAARMEAVLYNQVPKAWSFTKEFAHPIVITDEILEPKPELV
jgi:hypothetical protein